MAQYYRYCNNLVTGNGIYCTEKNKTMSESTAKTTNNCKLYVFNHVDAFYENADGYRPMVVDALLALEEQYPEYIKILISKTMGVWG